MNVSEFSQWAGSHGWLFIREEPSYSRIAGTESRIELWLSPEGRSKCVVYSNGQLSTVTKG